VAGCLALDDLRGRGEWHDDAVSLLEVGEVQSDYPSEVQLLGAGSPGADLQAQASLQAAAHNIPLSTIDAMVRKATHADLPQHLAAPDPSSAYGDGQQAQGQNSDSAKLEMKPGALTAASAQLTALEKGKIAGIERQERQGEKEDANLKAKIAALKLVDAEHTALSQVSVDADQEKVKADANALVKDKTRLQKDQTDVLSAKAKVGVPDIPKKKHSNY